MSYYMTKIVNIKRKKNCTYMHVKAGGGPKKTRFAWWRQVG